MSPRIHTPAAAPAASPAAAPLAAAPAAGSGPAVPPSDVPGGFCPRFHHAVELIGRRWTGVVVRAMFGGATRYSDIRAAVPDLSDKMLAERLKELEAEGVVRRTVVPSTPVRVEYHLTEKGRDLDAALGGIARWAAAWVGGPGDDGSGCGRR